MTRLRSAALLLAACNTAPIDRDSDTAPPVLAECPDYDQARSDAVLQPDLTEASGLVLGAGGDVLWTHNDSGDRARLFALSATGQPLGTVQLTDAQAQDWEDIARVDIDGVSTLVVADTGDNARARPSVALVLVSEPLPPGEGVQQDAVVRSRVRVSFTEGPQDVEAVAIDPLDGTLVMLSKTLDGAAIYTAPGGWWNEEALELTEQAFLPLGSDALPGSPNATGMDIAADGSAVIVRTYTGAWLFRRPPGPVADAFDTEPCEAEGVTEQGEAIAFIGTDYVTLPEGEQPLLVRYSPEAL